LAYIKNLAIRTRLALGISLLIGAISLFIFYYFPAQLANQQIQALGEKAESIAKMTAFSIGPAMVFEDRISGEEVLKGVKQNPDLAYVIVTTQSGETFVTYNEEKAEHAAYRDVSSSIDKNGEFYKTKTPIILSDVSGDTVGQLCLGLSLEAVNDNVRQSRTVIAAVSAIIFVLGIGGVFVLSTIITGPLSQMVQTAQQIAGGDLSQRAQVNAEDEVGHLAQSFNRMVDHLATAQQTLENRVEERTNELQTANIDLVQAKDAAEAANRAKSAFLANMSHELRTPLNAILGFTQLMVRDQTLAPEHRDNLEVVTRSGEHLLSLINDVLEISKIEAGQTILSEEAFDIYRMLDDLEGMFQLRASDKDLQLIFDGTSDIPHYVLLDQGKLRQVLINLLNNAIKFTESGGITLRVRAEKRGDASHLLFEIEDTGPGIAAEEQKLLFRAFAQTETGHQSQEGTGLGLSISQQFVHLMQGEITVRSEVGIGSVFIFNVAYQIAQAEEAQQHAKASRKVIGLEPGQPSYRILIVEDRLENRKLLLRFLTPLGFDVREAVDGQQGVEVFEEWEPHLVWMDMRMPIMDGYEATKRIKATAKGQATVIIALTASVFEEDRSLVLSAGCDDFVRKPFKPEELFDALTKHLGVRFIYEDDDADLIASTEQQELTSESLADLSPEWKASFHSAANRADTDEMLNLLGQIQSDHATLAQGLTDMIHNFQLEELIAISEPSQGG